jgi:uncharacterized protein (DUF1501 family)
MPPFSRRQFLVGAGVAGVAGLTVATHSSIERALGVSSTPSKTLGKVAAPATGTSPSTTGPSSRGLSSSKGILVLVALYGGNDGLNTLVPYQDSAYLAARPTLGFQANEVIPLDNELALNPNLKGLKTLWDAKTLAIVRGVGHDNPTFSHFREMDIWQSAAPDTEEVTGWIGRYLDQATGHDPLFAMSLGPTLPTLLQGNESAGSSIPSGSLTLPHASLLQAPFVSVETPYTGEPELAGRVAQSGTDLLTVLHAVKDVLATQPPVIEGTNLETAPDASGPTTTEPTPTTAGAGGSGSGAAGGAAGAAGAGATATKTNALAEQLDLVARLIKGGLPTRVYVVSGGGFDTHSGEKPTQDGLLAQLDAAITGFVNAMNADPIGRQVVLMTFSEFGRRVAENASGGTDHGSSAPLFVAGPSVKGGYYGEEPSLTDLDDGNLQFTTDFRSVYATVTAGVLGIDPKAVLLGQTFPTIPFI